MRQALHEDLPVLFLQDTVVQQHQQAAIMQRANQPTKALFQRDDRRRNLIVEEGIAAVGIDRL